MAGETEVQGIALGLGLDITDWSAKIARAKQDLAGLRAAGQGLVFNTTLKGSRRQAAGQTAYVPTISPQFQVSKSAVSNLRVDINREMRALAQTGEGVLVPVRLGRLPYAEMRAEISRGLGQIPITVKVTNVIGGSRDPLTAVLSQSTGKTMGQSRAAIESAAASKGIAKRAEGGPVEGGGLLARIRAKEALERAQDPKYLVGEKRPEVYVPKTGTPELIGQHGPEVRSFPESGEIVPSVPEWVRRMKKNAKELTQRAEGGPVDPSMRRIQRRYRKGIKLVGDPGIATSLSGSLAQEMRQYQKELEYFQGLGSATFAPPRRPGGYPPPAPPAPPRVVRPPDPYAERNRAAEARSEAEVRARQRARQGVRDVQAALPDAPITSFSQEEAALRRVNPALGARTPRTAVGAEALFRLGGGRQRAVLQNRLVEVDKYLGQFERTLGKGVDPIQHFNGLLEKNGRDLTESAKATGLNSKATRDLMGVRKTEKSVLEDIKAHTAERAHILKQLEGSPTSLAKGFLALQGTFAAYQIGVTAVSTAVELGVKALSPAVDAMSDFSGAALKVGTDLAQKTRELGGNAPAAVATSAGAAGVSGSSLAYLTRSLGPSVIAQAAAQAAVEALDLRRAAFHTDVSGGTPGLTGGATGGFAGTGFGWQVFGGQESFSQTIARGLEEFSAKSAERYGIKGNTGGLFGNKPFDIPITGGFLFPDAKIGQNLDPEGKRTAAAEQARLSILNDTNEATGRGAIYLGQQQTSLQLLTREQLEARNALQGTNWDEVVAGFKSAAESAGDLDNASKEAAAGVVLFDTKTGQVVKSGEEYRKFLQQAAQGTTIESPEAFGARVAQELRGTLKSTSARGQLERNVLIPGQFGQDVAANPLQPAATGFAFVSEAERRAYGPTLARIDEQQKSLTAAADQGLAVQRQFVQDWAPALVGQFDEAMTGVKQYGAEIAGLNAAISNRQAALGAAQYGNNIRVLSRNLRDAQALTKPSGGRVSAGSDNLGSVNRAQFDLGRIAQQLSFALAQRQINFQTAVAGFQAPGITGQERAARLKEAQVEASFAQRSLNLQRQQFTLEGTAFTIQARRAVVDARAALDLEKQARDTQLFVLANEKRIAVAQLNLSRAQAQATSILQEAAQNHDAILSVADQRVKIFGGTIEGATNQLRAALGMGSVHTYMNPQGNVVTTTGGHQVIGEKDDGRPIYGATGLMFDTKGPTTITAGEVKGEKVVVLKNPRQETLSGALGPGVAGGAPIIIGPITISGNNISNDMDLDRIADRLAEKVEARLSTTAKLVGLRSATG